MKIHEIPIQIISIITLVSKNVESFREKKNQYILRVTLMHFKSVMVMMNCVLEMKLTNHPNAL
jgi:hypothetical protein